MTLYERNTVFRAGIAFCIAVSLVVAAVSFLIIPVYSSIMGENFQRPASLFQVISGWFLGSDYYAVYFSIVLSVLFSLVGTILILSFFERTSATEILYISFFVFSFSLEVIRLIVPLHLIYGFSSFYLLGATRVLLFARYFGIFALFTASVCAAGMEVQRTRNVIIITITAVFMIVLGIPVDTSIWDTSFKMVTGYNILFKTLEVIAFIAASINFFVAVKVRGSIDYAYVGIGVVLAFLGRNILLGTDNWIGSILGILLLSFGTWFICVKLHKINLWL